MLNLDDLKWKTLKGGYGVIYDVSVPLKNLFESNSGQQINNIVTELWDELYHQGDVGLASYYAVPYLVLLANKIEQETSNIIALIVTIETSQLNSQNPPVPKDLINDHNEALSQLGELGKRLLNPKWDLPLASAALSAIAVSKGELELAKAISLFEDKSLLKEFLENY